MNNEKQLKDYLHLYLGCEVKYSNGLHYGTARYDAVYPEGIRIAGIEIWMFFNQVQLILRRLESMTEEERREKDEIYWRDWYPFGVIQEMEARKIQHLLSKGFDLFGLIDAGLAIDAATIDE